MYQYYYVNKNEQPNGDHEVHTISCLYLPTTENRLSLGSFDNCADAVREAKRTFPKADGCFYCCKECHKS
ncbi:MAG: hypothetical protein PHS84_10830 [Paludibacter sp.]|nr:hypothetical protein [Paludibacter sp.]